jgi:GAF domain-containing protein
MPDRNRAAVPNVYLDIAAVLGELLGDVPLRDIAQTAREALQVAFAALSFPAPGFSPTTTLFVRDCLVMPANYVPCAATAATGDVFVVPRLPTDHHMTAGTLKLRSYAGCPLLDRQGHCVGVFYLMDTKPHRLTLTETSRLRTYARLAASRIEIVRRFGAGPTPSPREIIRRALQFAKTGQNREAENLIALAYAADDIAGIRQRTPDHIPLGRWLLR